ncbi:conserved hypothetical protein [uncultured Defluviicoccus sp.]|uniref:Uncharacterized protein n=1 Tax=metagenome TaxID=256318 RepID=A0A380TDI9_9ZZZZ|nr:conserved hypothetical protein [uncultured Defluviicoccus sp.]
MSEFVAHLPVATVTNPILLWLFKHGWEDPSWGHTPINQAALGLVLHDLSTKVANRALQEQIQTIAQQIVAENAKIIVK